MTLLARFRPRWAWITLALGLPYAVVAFTPGLHGPVALMVPSSLAFWFALAVLGFLGVRWSWRKWMFKVSRRLWLILILLSVLPALILTLLFVSVGWVSIGGQVSRALQGNIKTAESAMKRASQESADQVARQNLQLLGDVWIARVQVLPEGVKPDFVGLVWNDDSPLKGKGIFLRAVSAEGDHFRLLNISLGSLAARSKDLWGGRMAYRLDHTRGTLGKQRLFKFTGRDANNTPTEQKLKPFIPDEKMVPMEAWSQGDALKGGFAFHPFRLPAVGLKILDWGSGSEDIMLTATPETSLRELIRGYGFTGEGGNQSIQTMGIIIGLAVLLIFLAAIQFLALFMGLYLARQLGGSVDDLFAGVRRLSAGDFSARIKPRSKDQVGQLATAFNVMAERLLTSQKERDQRLAMEEELRVAREVQMHLLPDIPMLPGGAVVHATILPAKDVAGDYYDLFQLSDGRLAFLIADVSGKGTSAAFYAAETKGVVAALDKVLRCPKEVAIRLNEIWCEKHIHSKRMFITLIYGVFDPLSGAFELVRAGHPPAFLCRANGDVERLSPRGLGVGLSLERFEENLDSCVGTLAKGDSLICYTDGVTEAASLTREFFGEDRLQALLAEPGHCSITSILGAVSEFTEGQALDDDLTLLVLQR
jgi:serine phosphatase RsbU (regulator of sigma subunit)